MKTIKATSSLFFPGFVAAATYSGIPHLDGAATTAKFDARYDISSYAQESVDVSNSVEYKYILTVDATLPLQTSWQTGGLEIDRCIEWPSGESRTNFTWFGFRMQLPDDASISGGSMYSYITRSTKDLGYVQDFNTTSTLLQYNMTMKESLPTIRMTLNDDLFWKTYNFDFVQSDQGSAASDDSSYQEFKNKMYGAVSCNIPTGNNSYRILNPVVPTLTISLQRLEDKLSPAPTPPVPISAAITPRNKVFGLRVVTSILALAAAALL